MAKLTITLTGRAPVTIDKEQWLVIASAADHEDASRGKDVTEANWKQWLTVRQHADGRAIVYGVHDDLRPKESRRAGELLVIGSVKNGVELGDIPDAIYRVAAYLTFDRDLADKCIANLPAVDVEAERMSPMPELLRIETFLQEELDRRRESGLGDDDAYIATAVQALADVQTVAEEVRRG